MDGVNVINLGSYNKKPDLLECFTFSSSNNERVKKILNGMEDDYCIVETVKIEI